MMLVSLDYGVSRKSCTLLGAQKLVGVIPKAPFIQQLIRIISPRPTILVESYASTVITRSPLAVLVGRRRGLACSALYPPSLGGAFASPPSASFTRSDPSLNVPEAHPLRRQRLRPTTRPFLLPERRLRGSSHDQHMSVYTLPRVRRRRIIALDSGFPSRGCGLFSQPPNFMPATSCFTACSSPTAPLPRIPSYPQHAAGGANVNDASGDMETRFVPLTGDCAPRALCGGLRERMPFVPLGAHRAQLSFLTTTPGSLRTNTLPLHIIVPVAHDLPRALHLSPQPLPLLFRYPRVLGHLYLHYIHPRL
ncbi:hypothetical protein K438DRAFT_2017746 [Mycena galopus ATCC 62051]|nr:hypothetical protein K438DRAFT_2017746 [Mycena galopus ATCC 62051]